MRLETFNNPEGPRPEEILTTLQTYRKYGYKADRDNAQAEYLTATLLKKLAKSAGENIHDELQAYLDNENLIGFLEEYGGFLHIYKAESLGLENDDN